MNDALKKMQSGHKTWDGPLTAKIFHDLLIKRIEALDVESAKADIIRFASNPDGLSICFWQRLRKCPLHSRA